MTDSPWALYQRLPSYVLGFHGTENTLVSELVSGRQKHLAKSEGRFEWLGHGVYFWENDPQRGLEWARHGRAKKTVREPDVVGAIIDPGFCLDLTTRVGLDEVREAYGVLCDAYELSGKTFPRNTGSRRELDCQVIQTLHTYRQAQGLTAYDSVRAPFHESEPLYPDAGFNLRNHIQIAVINLQCIKGYFRPLAA